MSFHNEIQRTLASPARAVGYPIEETPADLFVSAINPLSRNAYLQEIRENPERGFSRGALVPDIFERANKRMHDVKTTGVIPDQ